MELNEEIIKRLEKDLSNIEKEHGELRLTAKVWAEKRREITLKIREINAECDELRIKAWRTQVAKDMQTRLQLE